METRWYPMKKDGMFWLGADGLPFWSLTLDELLSLHPNCYTYVTHHRARKNNDYQFDWTPRGFIITECPF